MELLSLSGLANAQFTAPPRSLTPEQVDMLSHLSLIDLPVEQGETNKQGETSKTLRFEGVNVPVGG
jgi:hypothetical protein